MRRRFFLVMTVSLAGVLAGCGGSTDPGPSVESLTLSPDQTQIDTLFAIGSTLQLTPSALDGSGNRIASAKVVFTTSAPAIADVSSTGLVTAKGNGSATITVTSGGVSDSRLVRVRQKATRIEINPPSTILLPARTRPLSAVARDSKNFAILGVGTTTFSSNLPSIADVNASTGVVTSVAVGLAVITATMVTPDGTFQATANITVTDAIAATARVDMLGSSFTPLSVDIAAGGTVTFANGSFTEHNVTFAAGSGIQTIPNHTSGQNTRTFPAVGTFPFGCTLHSGMTGVVNVH